ncbi:MAG: YegS/Rv2252/BmrU family lipid kinase [Acidimicrobiia bacterium]|nr:YegS/Rv2252/BmrU family lipid kinase [Acidimicrobiia bacterium]
MGIVHLLLNPAVDGRRRAAADDEIRHCLRAHGHEVVELRPPATDLVATTIAEARHEDVTRLVIAGGDGLLHHALPAIAGSDVAVGIVPVGTGNDFARALGLPSRIEAAVEAALAEPTAIDAIATTDGRWAASVVTGGFSGRVNARANDLRFPKGQQRYTIATFVELARLRSIDLELTVDGTTHDLSATLFAVGNTRYFGGGMAICPLAVPSDGVLDVTVVGPTTRRELAMVLPTVFTGRHIDHPAVTTLRGRHIEIRAATDLWADGECFVPVTATTTTSLRAVTGALQVAGTLVGT